jgi:hypothetical protein
VESPDATRVAGLSSAEITALVLVFAAAVAILITSSLSYAATLRASGAAEARHPLLREEGLY